MKAWKNYQKRIKGDEGKLALGWIGILAVVTYIILKKGSL